MHKNAQSVQNLIGIRKGVHMMRTTMPREEATVMVSQSVFGALLADSLNEALRAIYNNDNN